jgi:Cytochrome oxidase complex assembly protein 1
MTDGAQPATDPRTVPGEIDRWNWGAFLLSWIWGIGNGTPIALLTFVPIVGLVMVFVLGAKGSRWAWRNKRWDSVEHFKRVQRKWAIAGVIVWIGGIGIFAASFVGAFSILKNSEAYKLGVAQLQASPLASNALGTPITAGRPNGSMSTENQSGNALLNFPVSGPKASGTALVEAVKKDGVWTLTRLAFKLDGGDSVIEIIGGGARNNST